MSVPAGSKQGLERQGEQIVTVKDKVPVLDHTAPITARTKHLTPFESGVSTQHEREDIRRMVGDHLRARQRRRVCLSLVWTWFENQKSGLGTPAVRVAVFASR